MDNSSSIGQEVLHTFYKAGHYNITLSAIDSGTPSQNAFANTLVTIISSANQTTNATNSVNATDTGSVNATDTGSVNATDTGSVNATDTGSVNATDTGSVNATDTGSVNATDTGSVNATDTGSVNATDTGSVNANTTGKVPSTKIEISNSTVQIAPATVNLGANSTKGVDEKQSAAKFNLKKIERFSTANDKNVTIITNKEVDADSANHIPVALDQSVTIYENKMANIDLRGSDQDNDRITFKLVSNPLEGILAGFDKRAGTVTYIPNPFFAGSDIFTFNVIDIHNGESNIAHVSISVDPIRKKAPIVSDVEVCYI